MNFRIIEIKGCATCNQVLLARSRHDDGIDFVEMTAWHKEEGGLFFQYEIVNFDTEILIGRFIADFSEVSANEFANSFSELNSKSNA